MRHTKREKFPSIMQHINSATLLMMIKGSEKKQCSKSCGTNVGLPKALCRSGTLVATYLRFFLILMVCITISQSQTQLTRCRISATPQKSRGEQSDTYHPRLISCHVEWLAVVL